MNIVNPFGRSANDDNSISNYWGCTCSTGRNDVKTWNPLNCGCECDNGTRNENANNTRANNEF